MRRRSRLLTAAVALAGGLAAVLAGPGRPERQARAQALGAPIPKQVFNARMPVFEESTLANGLTVYSYQDDYLPLVSVGLAVRAGNAAEPPGKAGLAQLAYHLLIARSASSDGESGAPTVLEVGGTLTANADPDGGQLQLNVLTAQAERAVAALAALTQQPVVAPRELQRLKAEQLATLSQARGRPQFLAEEQLRQLIYGPLHPYGHVASGTPATISSITPQDVAAYYGCSLFPKNVALVVAGRVTAATVRQWAMRYLGSWQASGQACERPLVPPVASKRTEVIAIARPGLSQTLLLLGRAMAPLGNPDEQALELADLFLKGRSSYQLRLKRGITYSVSGQLSHKLHGGHFSVSTQVQADQTGEALSELLSQLFAVQHESVPPRVVISMRVGLGWALVSQYQTLPSSVLHIAQLFRWRQPLTWDQTRLQRLQQAGPIDVDAAASRYFNRNLMQIVVVGDPEIIKTQVGALNLGPLRFTGDCPQSGTCD